jgi:excisionase family DNA binding protein
MTVRQVAARLEVSPATVYGLVNAGKLRCFRVGMGRGAIRVSDEHLAEYLKGSEPIAKSVPAPVHRPRLKHLQLPR